MGFFDFLKVDEYKKQIANLTLENVELRKRSFTIDQLNYLNLQEEIARLNTLEQRLSREINEIELNRKISSDNAAAAQDEFIKISKNIDSSQRKLGKIKTLHKSLNYTVDTYFKEFAVSSEFKLSGEDQLLLDELAPTVTLKLHCMDIKSLRKAYNDNGKLIRVCFRTLNPLS